jgi:hypothetical protein
MCWFEKPQIVAVKMAERATILCESSFFKIELLEFGTLLKLIIFAWSLVKSAVTRSIGQKTLRLSWLKNLRIVFLSVT